MSYQSKIEAYPHQRDALAKMHGKRNFALLMAMRTGKTKVVLDDFGELELVNQVSDLLVIAPAGVYRTWESAIHDHVSDELRLRLLIHTWSSGMGKTESAKLAHFMDQISPRILLMNVEALSRPGDARLLCKEFLRQRASMCVLDESTIAKNPIAKRTKFLVKELGHLADYRRILSGLPTPRSPLDLYSQFEFLNWEILGYRSYFAFRNRFAIMKPMNFGGRWIQIVSGYTHEDELQELIRPHSFRVEFRPKIPSTYSVRHVELTSEQEKAYREIKEFATTKLANDSHVTATVVIAQIMRMHQVLCGHVKDEMGVEHFVPELRTKALMELLEDFSAKAIIWCSYDADIRKVSAALKEEYGGEAVARFWGGNQSTREDEEKAFLNLPLCRFMVATPSAGGRGRTWSNADLVIYYSNTDNLEHRDQSEQRAQGMNKERQVDYVDLLVPGTVDEKIIHALRNKINMAATINGDTYREWLI